MSDEAIKNNTEYLKTIGYVQEDEDFKTLASTSEKIINDIYLRMLPIIIAAVIVVLFGLSGSIAISTLKQLKTFSVFFLCGCRWKDCIKIISANIAIIFAGAIVVMILGGYAMSALNIEYLIGLVFDYNNIIISVVLLAAMYLLSIVLPHNLVKTSSPLATIKENV